MHAKVTSKPKAIAMSQESSGNGPNFGEPEKRLKEMGLDGRFEPTAKPGYFKTTDGNAIVLNLKYYKFSSTDELYQKVIDPLNQ